MAMPDGAESPLTRRDGKAFMREVHTILVA
jgi:hypothetical protein